MRNIKIPDQYQEGLLAICTMSAEDFELVLEAARTLPLEYHEHMLVQAFKKRLGDKAEALRGIPETVISLVGLREIYGGHGESVGKGLVQAMGAQAEEMAEPIRRFALLSDAIVAPVARHHAMTSFGENRLNSCVVRSGVSIVTKIKHDDKSIAYNTFTLHLSYGGENNPSMLTLDMPLEDIRELREAILMAIHEAEQNEKNLKDSLSFIRQEEYGMVQ